MSDDVVYSLTSSNTLREYVMNMMHNAATITNGINNNGMVFCMVDWVIDKMAVTFPLCTTQLPDSNDESRGQLTKLDVNVCKSGINKISPIIDTMNAIIIRIIIYYDHRAYRLSPLEFVFPYDLWLDVFFDLRLSVFTLIIDPNITITIIPTGTM